VRSIAPWRAAAASCVLAACSSTGTPRDAANYEPTPQEPMPVDAGGDRADGVVDGATCTTVIEQHPDEGANHVACTSNPAYQTQPPSSGNHFGCWPEYRTFAVPVPWGNLVHALEHGAMIIVYNCGTEGCLDETLRAQTFIDHLPADPVCGTSHRVILAPDPTLPVRWAATAWTWTLRADCFDEAAFSQFYTDHYGHGLEAVCGSGAPYANLCDGVICG
jgi:Protein of unknown function (DUF3105)